MNIDYLEQAKERVPNIPLLINMVSRRVRQLNAGQRPLIKPDTPSQANLDVALKEVANGLLEAEIIYTPPEESTPPEDTLLTL
jgi:DNA-directed RNA polymerase subunit omega